MWPEGGLPFRAQVLALAAGLLGSVLVHGGLWYVLPERIFSERAPAHKESEQAVVVVPTVEAELETIQPMLLPEEMRPAMPRFVQINPDAPAQLPPDTWNTGAATQRAAQPNPTATVRSSVPKLDGEEERSNRVNNNIPRDLMPAVAQPIPGVPMGKHDADSTAVVVAPPAAAPESATAPPVAAAAPTPAPQAAATPPSVASKMPAPQSTAEASAPPRSTSGDADTFETPPPLAGETPAKKLTPKKPSPKPRPEVSLAPVKPKPPVAAAQNPQDKTAATKAPAPTPAPPLAIAKPHAPAPTPPAAPPAPAGEMPRDLPEPLPRPQMAKSGTTGVLLRNPTGTNEAGTLALDAKYSEFGDYSQRMLEVIQASWWMILQRTGIMERHSAEVTIAYTLCKDGTLKDVVVESTSAGRAATYACKDAIEARAPYDRWTPQMVAMLGDEYRSRCSFRYR